MTYVITDACIDVKDKACISECPVDCIYEGPRSLYIHPDECIDCGACEVVCPTTAIIAEFDVTTPEETAAADRARELLVALGASDGSRRFGVLAEDHPVVASRPQ